MPGSCRFCLAIYFLMAGGFSGLLAAQETKTIESVLSVPLETRLEVDVEATFGPPYPGATGMPPIARAVVRNVHCGEKHCVNLVLTNPGDQTISFDFYRTGCNCGDIQFDQLEVPAGGMARGRLLYTAPVKSADPSPALGITLYANGSVAGRVALEMELVGNLSELEPSILLDSSPILAEAVVPFVFSFPVTRESIEISLDPVLRSIAKEKLEFPDEGKGVVRLAFAPRTEDGETANRSTVTGEITIRDRNSDLSATVGVVIRELRDIRISPEVLIFRSEDVGGKVSGFLVASAILSNPKELPIQSVALKAAGVPCDLEMVPLTKRHLR